MPRRAPRTEHSIDWLGAGLLAAGTGALLLGLVWGGRQYGLGSAHVVGALAVAVTLLALFALVERRAPEPILPFDVLRNPIVAGSVACMALVGMAMFGTISYVPLFVQGVIGTSATSSGVVLTPMILGAVITSVLTGQLVSRTGRYRWNAVLGPVVLTVGMVLLWRMNVSTTNGEAARNMVIAGIGIGSMMQVFVLSVQNAVPRSADRLGDGADAVRPPDGRHARRHRDGRDRQPRPAVRRRGGRRGSAGAPAAARLAQRARCRDPPGVPRRVGASRPWSG